jgi:hypothetical protein
MKRLTQHLVVRMYCRKRACTSVQDRLARLLLPAESLPELCTAEDGRSTTSLVALRIKVMRGRGWVDRGLVES